LKGFYTRQSGDSVKTATGEKLDIDDVSSEQLRIGARYSRLLTPSARFYVGAA
jgi:hypothetical protein